MLMYKIPFEYLLSEIQGVLEDLYPKQFPIISYTWDVKDIHLGYEGHLDVTLAFNLNSVKIKYKLISRTVLDPKSHYNTKDNLFRIAYGGLVRTLGWGRGPLDLHEIMGGELDDRLIIG